MLNSGTEAPDFTITLGTGEEFTLSAHRGRNVVIYFYPRAFTAGCTAETKGFQDAYQQISDAGAIVLGVSTDQAEIVSEFGQQCGVEFELGSDISGEVRRLYEAERRFGLGTSRITYVIDRNGIIRGVFHNEVLMEAHVRNAVQILRDLP